MPSSAPCCCLKGLFFDPAPIRLKRYFSGYRMAVLKMSKWALFEILDLIIAQMKSGPFAGFSKNARIGKQGILWGFRDLYSTCWHVTLDMLISSRV